MGSMDRKYWRGQELDPDPSVEDEIDPLGPDERDQDLLEDRWASVKFDQPKPRPSPLVRYGIPAVTLIAAASLLVPMLSVFTR